MLGIYQNLVEAKCCSSDESLWISSLRYIFKFGRRLVGKEKYPLSPPQPSRREGGS